MDRKAITVATFFAAIFAGAISGASELVYRPINPGFGGFPSNFDYLMTLADIQNRYADSGGSDVPIIDFPDVDIDLGDVGNPDDPTTDPDTTVDSSAISSFRVGNN